MIRKNFNAIVFTGNTSVGNKGYVKYRKVWWRDRFMRFINRKYPGWRFMWLYSRANGDYEYVKRNDI